MASVARPVRDTMLVETWTCRYVKSHRDEIFVGHSFPETGVSGATKKTITNFANDIIVNHKYQRYHSSRPFYLNPLSADDKCSRLKLKV